MDDEEIDSIRSNLNGILSLLGWTEESLFKEQTKVQCPLDANHMVPESSLKSHIERCKWLKGGYTKEEMEKNPPSSSFCYPDSVSVTLDKELLSKITSGIYGSNSGFSGYVSGISKPPRDVPKTMDRFIVEFSPQERLAVYDYVVTKTKEATKSSEVAVDDLLLDFEKKDDKADKPKSRLEILAEQRDYKRRRPTYRAKNVHITKKSYTEVMKEVIENQMSYLTEIQKESKSHSDSKRQENTYHDHRKEKYEESSDEQESDNTDYSSYKSDKRSTKSYESSHRKRKRSRSRSRDRHRHSSSHKHKSSHHDRDRKHHKY